MSEEQKRYLCKIEKAKVIEAKTAQEATQLFIAGIEPTDVDTDEEAWLIEQAREKRARRKGANKVKRKG